MLRRRFGAYLIALFVAVVVSHAGTGVASADACPAAAAMPGGGAAPGQARRAILCLVNRVRATRSLPAVRVSRQLGAAASAHARDMVARRYFAHDGPAGDNLAVRVRRSGYGASHPGFLASEALAWGEQASPQVLVRALLESFAHRRIVLNPRARNIGLGLALGAPADAVLIPSATLVLVFSR